MDWTAEWPQIVDESPVFTEIQSVAGPWRWRRVMRLMVGTVALNDGWLCLVMLGYGG